VNDAATPHAMADLPTCGRTTAVGRWERCGGAFVRRRRRFREPSTLPTQLRSVLLLLASLSFICTGGCRGDSASRIGDSASRIGDSASRIGDSASRIKGRYVLDREATKALLGQDLEAARDPADRGNIERLMKSLDEVERVEFLLETGGAELVSPDGETIRGWWRRLGDGGRVELVFDGESRVAEVDDGSLLVDIGSSADAPIRWSFSRVETPLRIEGRYVLDREATMALLGQYLVAARDSADRDNIETLIQNLDEVERFEFLLEAGGAELVRPDGVTMRGWWRRLGDGGRVELVFDGESRVAEVDHGSLLVDIGSSAEAPIRVSFIRAEMP
jgi:hypothetical protein